MKWRRFNGQSIKPPIKEINDKVFSEEAWWKMVSVIEAATVECAGVSRREAGKRKGGVALKASSSNYYNPHLNQIIFYDNLIIYRPRKKYSMILS